MSLRGLLVRSLVAALVALTVNQVSLDWVDQVGWIRENRFGLRSAVVDTYNHVVSCFSTVRDMCARWLLAGVDWIPHDWLDDKWRDTIRKTIDRAPQSGSQSAPRKDRHKVAFSRKTDSASQSESVSSTDRVLSADELAQYTGDSGRPIYLAILGHVFDVTRGRRHYGAGGGYSGFAGRDATRAFISGDFSAAGLVDSIDELSGQDLLGLDGWLRMYRKDYQAVGVLHGRYYDASGKATAYQRRFFERLAQERGKNSLREVEQRQFPACNSEWRAEEGHGGSGKGRVYCTPTSGDGRHRGWTGVPRQLHTTDGEGRRCACVKDRGPPSIGPDSGKDRGDLDNPRLREYPGCHPKSQSCNFS